MSLDLDAIIFVSFLALNLGVGLFYCSNTKNAKEYAIGEGKFSRGALVATIVATSIGAGTFSYNLSETYRQGLYYIIPAVLSDFIGMLIIGYILIPRMKSFFGALSVAEAMGQLYGKNVRVITAIAGLMMSMGIVASQFKVSAMIMQLFFDIQNFYAMIVSASIVILYSSFGGIKAVTFTDILQFFTFAIMIPLICIVIWNTSLGNPWQVFQTISTNPLFDLKEVFDINNPRMQSFIFLLFVFIIPGIGPETFQRISMAGNISLAKKSFISAGCVFAVIVLIVCWTGVLLLSGNPNLAPDNLLPHIMNNYTYIGLKGLTAIGIMATIMSTADSYINCASVLLTHDIIRVYNIQSIKPENEVLLLRIVAFTLGIAALAFAFSISSLFHLIIKTLSFYMPVVSVPLLLAIFGFQSSSRVVIIGMAAGALVVVLWSIYGNPEISETPIAMAANLIAFIIAHLLSGRPKGKFKMESSGELDDANGASHNLFSAIRNFNCINFCKQSFLQGESLYVYVGLFTITSVFIIMHFMPPSAALYYEVPLNLLYSGALICAAVLLTRPIWSLSYKNKKFMYIFQMIALSYILVFMPLTSFLINSTGQLNTVILLINLTIFGLLTRWQVALGIIILMSYASINFYEAYNNTDINPGYLSIGMQFKITCILSLIGAVLIAFIKPKQEEQEKACELNEDLNERLEDQDKQILALSNLKHVFLRNLQHETNTPITGVYSMSQALRDCYDKLTDQQRKDAINTIVTSSERLISYANNLIDVSKLTNASYKLNLRRVNLSSLLGECIRKCERLYIPAGAEEDRVFTITIESNLMAMCDEYYIRKSFENLIINAIQYCKKGQINIVLEKIEDNIKFSIKDSGIGIPEEDMAKVFDPFTTSSKTQTPAGGRGMGLALVKATAEIHKGTIEAKSEGKGGSTFIMVIPQAQQEIE